MTKGACEGLYARNVFKEPGEDVEVELIGDATAAALVRDLVWAGTFALSSESRLRSMWLVALTLQATLLSDTNNNASSTPLLRWLIHLAGSSASNLWTSMESQKSSQVACCFSSFPERVTYTGGKALSYLSRAFAAPTSVSKTGITNSQKFWLPLSCWISL